MTTKPIARSVRILDKIIADVAEMPGVWAVATPLPRRVGRGVLTPTHAGHMVLVDDTGRALAAVKTSGHGGPWGYYVFPIAPNGVDFPQTACGDDVLTVPYRAPAAEAAERIAAKVPRYRESQVEALEFTRECDRYRAEAARIVASAARRLGDPDPHVIADPARTATEPWAYWHGPHALAQVKVGFDGLLTIEISVTAHDLDTAFARLPMIDKGAEATRAEAG